MFQENYREDLSRNWYLPQKFEERKQLYTDLEGVMDTELIQQLQNAANPEEKILPTSG